MTRKLKSDEGTVKIEFKAPMSMKFQAQQMAAEEGDGDLSAWLRSLIRAEWRRRQDAKKGRRS